MTDNNTFTIGVVGLGLIGGSFAKAYHAAGHKVLAFDTDSSILEFAKLSGNVDADLTRENLKECDLILICVYPQAAVVIVDAEMDAAKRFGFTYVGGHPMAGTQYSGFKHARKDMYKGAPMVIVPPANDDLDLLMRIKELLAPAGFNSITVSSAEKHDEMIAFTSQLAHVVSSAYIKSPTANAHKGFSAGSYKDMTRVAWLNPEMWAQLFLDNKDYLADEIDALIENLTAYKEAVAAGDKEALIKLLDEGRRRKEEIDG